MARAVGVQNNDIADASLFTTQTITAISDKVRAQIQAAGPPSARFDLGTAGERTVFPLSSLAPCSGTAQRAPDDFGNTLVAAGRAFGIRPRRLDGRVRLVPVARLRDGRQAHPAVRDRDGNAGRTKR